jgi:hypothetical protein
MKYTSLRSFAGASLLALGLATSVVATPIDGSISFNGTPNFDQTPLSSSGGIVSYNSAHIAFVQQTGDYASLPNLLPVTFSPFFFNPPTQSVNPLWTFEYDGLTYSARTTSMVSSFNAASNIWNFGGDAILSITGYDDTPAEWNFSTGRIGNSYYFGSAAATDAPSVPDSGGTMLMLALGLGGMMIASRSRLIRAGKQAQRELSRQLLG